LMVGVKQELESYYMELLDAKRIRFNVNGFNNYIRIFRPVNADGDLGFEEKLVDITLDDGHLFVIFNNRHHPDPIMNMLMLAKMYSGRGPINEVRDPGINEHRIELADPNMLDKLCELVDQALRIAGL
jgi:hypothetical protein